MAESTFRVLVVGAGPVGLSIGLALARQGIHVDVVEKETSIPAQPKASTFHPPTLQIFDEWGVLGRIDDLGLRIPRAQYWRKTTGEMIAEFSFDLLADHTPYPYRLHLDQYFITSTLMDAVRQEKHATVRMGVELVDLEQHTDHVTTVLEEAGDRDTSRYDIVLGADGMKSTTRRLVGIDYAGYANPGYHLLVAVEDYELATPYDGLAPVAMFLDPVDWVDIIANPGWLKVIFHADTPDSDEATARARVDSTGIFAPGYRVRHSHTYRTYQLVTPRITHGRVALLGDAAHINVEFGGMGLNSGIHDAYHLARNVARIAEGSPVDIEFADYEHARSSATTESVQQETIKNTQALKDPDAEVQAITDAAADRESATAFLLRKTMIDSTRQLFEPLPHPAAVRSAS